MTLRRKPSTTESNGRTSNGRFAAGNQYAVGNPFAARVAELRRAMLEGVTAGDVRAIVKALVKQARGGDLAAAREILDRTMGKARSTVEIQQTLLDEAELDAEIESVLARLADRRSAPPVEPRIETP